MAAYTYAPHLVACSWAPVGYAPMNFTGKIDGGDFVNGAYDDPERVKTTSAFGITVHTLATNDAGSVTITLQAVSPDAKMLRQLHLTSELLGRTTGAVIAGPLTIREPYATKEQITLEDATITSSPEVTFGAEGPQRAFVFKGRYSVQATGLT